MFSITYTITDRRGIIPAWLARVRCCPRSEVVLPGNWSTDVISPQVAADCARDGKIDPAIVRAQLERILASAPFRNSKRYPALLRYVVERSLDGASAEL